MGDTTTGLLPISGATLATDARALAAVQAIGARHGVDYTDDATVTALFAERRRAIEATQHNWRGWVGVLVLTAGLILPMVSVELPERSANLGFLVTGPILVVAAALITAAWKHWKRELTHPTLTGYREVLGVARAHGLPLTHVPAWLEGRSSTGGGKGWAPIPTYPGVAPQPEAMQPEAAQPVTPQSEAGPTAVPPKPAAVTRYEEMAEAGGWHDETGCLLLFAGLIGAGWAWSNDAPLGYFLLALVPLAIVVWVAGSRQGDEKRELRAEALAYVRAVTEAQAAGARVPELSRVLKKLLDE
ncbi:hypothetical protein AB0I00_07375 [Streptomyces sp. NPDC050803]|uniref:hypothetical protein n=1 Tax=unclassified Streptomyces TaxID=2593676 RepID=UPI00343E74E9